MAIPNPFYRRTPNTITRWGYTFELTDQHLTPAQYQPLKHTYDVLGEQVLNRLNEISPPPRQDLPRSNSQFSAPHANASHIVNGTEKEEPKIPPRDLYLLLRDHVETDDLLRRFWREVNTVPDWVDWEQISRGQDVFYRYGAANLTGLAYHSLLGGMGAARVVETLARTGGFSIKVARRRLFETTQHILQCTKSLESIQPGGDGWASTIRVRLLHAAVRNRIMKLAETRPGYYDTKAWGVPINDWDSMATINSFSAALIWLSLPRQGIFLRRQEIADFIALWRYIAYVVGCPTDEFESPDQARRLMESLLLYEIKPSETSRILANNIIKCLQGQPPGYATEDFLVASARWLNGNALCDELGLMRPGLYYWALMAGQCIFFCFFNYSNRIVPSWDRKKIDLLKRVFYQVIVHTHYGLKGEESRFEFRYVPEYETITELGESMEEKTTHSAVERRNLKFLLMAVGVLGLGTWVAFMVARRVVRAVFL